MNKAETRSNASSRFVLGTAQLGMRYGINNRVGQPSPEDACDLVNAAWQGGITEFDTAQAYGASEENLGVIFSKLRINRDVRMISKMGPELNFRDPAALDAALEGSLGRLQIKKLSGLMLHHERQLEAWDNGLGAWLIKQQTQGTVGALGVSLYTPEKARMALEMKDIQFIQIPSNILDRRFETAGVFQRASELRKTIYIRSIFLQGLLLMPPGAVPGNMAFAAESLRRASGLAQRLNLSMDELCMGYVLHRWPPAHIVFGAETKAQVSRNLTLAEKTYPSCLIEAVENELRDIEERVMNPTMWPR